MKITTKNSIAILNAILSIVAWSFAAATVWLDRYPSDEVWIYLDGGTLILFFFFVASAVSFITAVGNTEKTRGRTSWIISAISNIIPVVAIVILLVGSNETISYNELLRIWRIYFAVALNTVAVALYLVIAFTKTKPADEIDETIPYSD